MAQQQILQLGRKLFRLSLEALIVARYSVITGKCIKDMLCITVCLRKAIHPKKDEPEIERARQLYINPKKCLGCGSCIAACRNGAIFEIEALPYELKDFAEINAAYSRK